MRYFCAFAAACLLFASCKPPVYTPKPMGYYRVDLPEHIYQPFEKEGYPYSFEYPVYGIAYKDTLTKDGLKPENKYWMNIDFPTWSGRIYLSYRHIDGSAPMGKLLEDTHGMSYYHTKKADYINPNVYVNPNGITILTFSVGGDAASAYQFVATDSVRHFLRGSLYFDVSPNADSLRPVNEFFKKDIDQLINTLKWKE
jgi:gliding motility-associated lipoprotein GldD